MKRVEERVRKGGHNVPEADIRRRFNRSKQNFWSIYRHLVDEWHLFYNSVKGFQKVASGIGATYNTMDDELFALFCCGISRMIRPTFDADFYRRADEYLRIGNAAVRKAQEESRRLGVPNVYCINGIIYYELPNGELSRTDPFVEPTRKGSS